MSSYKMTGKVDIRSDRADSTGKVGGGAVAKNLRLKAARVERDLTQEQLAARVEVTRQTINAIERGDYNPSIGLCIRICRALGKTLDDLFWEETA